MKKVVPESDVTLSGVINRSCWLCSRDMVLHISVGKRTVDSTYHNSHGLG